jgi:chromosomal replication initiation ATPase DnaA
MNTAAKIRNLEDRVDKLESHAKAAPVLGSDVYARRVLLAVAHVAGVTIKGIKGKDKSRRNVEARLACACIMHEDSPMKDAEIGAVIGKDRTSVSGYKHCFGRVEVRVLVTAARGLLEDRS